MTRRLGVVVDIIPASVTTKNMQRVEECGDNQQASISGYTFADHHVSSLRGLASRLLFVLAFVFLYAGAWAQATTTVASGTSSDTPMLLEVWGAQDASVSATPVERTSPNGNPIYGAYDINITKDGKEWQPEPDEPAIVTMEAADFVDGQMLDIYHEGANGPEFVATVAAENGKIVFPAPSFSVYIVAQSGEFARLKVTFHRADGRDVTVYVKPADLEPDVDHSSRQGGFNSIVFNPGMGTPDHASGVLCMGWTASDSYNASTVAITFDDVRTLITNKLNEGVTDGEEMDFYTMLFKSYNVAYLDDKEAVVNTDQLLYRADAAAPSWNYTVNAAYTPGDNTSNFEGWKVREGGTNIDGYTSNEQNYRNETDVTIHGDVVFSVNVSKGHWLVFHENGKGATYKAADFIHADSVTVAPPEGFMQRKGYRFGGWYLGEPAHEGENPTGDEFSFGDELIDNTHIYAQWIPNETAPYTVIFWTQNLQRDGYEVKNSYVKANATVGRNIPYSSVDNGDEDFATGDWRDYGHYTGFCLKESSKNQRVVITPEGDAVLNLYYDRIEYNFKFYLYRNGTQNNRYDYPNNSGSGSSLDGLVTWHQNQTQHPGVTPASGFTIQSETVSNRKYYYFVMQAYYGEDISSKWPTYDKITGANGKEAVSYVMMVGTKLKPNPTNQGSGTVKGIITVMNENILGATNNSNGNYVMVRFPDSYYNWRYHIWFEAVEGEDYSGITTHTYNGKRYYEETVVVCRSSNTTDGNQNEPKYIGFDYVTRLGQNASGTTWQGGHWTTTEGGTTLYHLNFVYNRQQYKISYFDGNYVDGNNNMIQNRANQLLVTEENSPIYGQGVAISQSDKEFVPTCPESGYVFEGWYIDKGCTAPYHWSSMPVGGITVYAKWRQIQYRVFLHPNADAVTDLDWGSDDQDMNFRISYGGHISAPTGTSENYEFVGWFTNEACTSPFNEYSVVLNDETVTTNYDKTDPINYTDPMDKWGHIGSNPFNSDLTGNGGSERLWITKKYDLYGKWRAKLNGANGINLVYDANEGNNAPDEHYLYQDNVFAIAGHACSHSDATREFSHWVLQHYDGGEYVDIEGSHILPGEKFNVLKSDSKMVVIKWYNPADTSDVYRDEFDPSSTTPPDGTHKEFLATYTIQLRAVYVDVESRNYPFVQWRMNDTLGTIVRTDGMGSENPLNINEDLVPPAPTRDGYIFKGWFKYNVPSGAVVPTSLSECTPNFLFYNNNRYYKESNYSTEVNKLAVDRFKQDDYMYAVWEPIVDFEFGSVCQGEPLDLPDTTTYGVGLTGRWTAPDGSGIVSGATYTATSVNNTTLTFTPDALTCAPVSRFNVSFRTPELTNASYNYIWKGGADGRLADWNTASNWYVYDSRNSSYSIATELPNSEKNIYVGPAQCVSANWPSQNGEAYANNLTIASTASLTVPAGRTLNIAGDLIVDGTLNANNASEENRSKLVFNGVGNQTITKTGVLELRDVEFAQTGDDIHTITAANGITVNGNATFNKGIVNADVLFEKNSKALNVTDSASFVSGKVTKKTGTTAETNFVFPTGSAADGQPKVLGSMQVASLAANGNTEVTFRQKSNDNGDGSHGFTLAEYPRWWNINDMCSDNATQFDHVSNYEYWDVRTSAALSATLTVSADKGVAHFNTNSQTYNGSDIFGAYWTGSCWSNIGGSNQSVTEDSFHRTITVEGVRIPVTRSSDEKIVTLGSRNHSTVLPIELTALTATCDGRSSLVEWTTATEKNNDYFIIERSDNAIDFTEVARVAGAGNSITSIDYSYIDYGVHGGDNYYRLVQVDYDGTRTVSEIVVTICEEAVEEPEVIAYPNPFDGDLTVELENFGNRPARIDVVDVLGRVVYTEEVGAPQNNYQMVLHLNDLPKATYMVHVATSDFVINRKVVKQ